MAQYSAVKLSLGVLDEAAAWSSAPAGAPGAAEWLWHVVIISSTLRHTGKHLLTASVGNHV